MASKVNLSFFISIFRYKLGCLAGQDTEGGGLGDSYLTVSKRVGSSLPTLT
jgi:hypothetical protein